jgi:XTP/dITP diphosphohydrolase
MTSLLIATTNPGKIAELRAMLAGSAFRVIGVDDLPERYPDVEETGATFAENALLKADFFHAQTGLLTLADDSGLAVDALDGRPGVYSARYGGKGRSSAEQIQLLLDELEETPDERRTARFICTIALVGDAIRQVFEGRCEGTIGREARGTGGFGYDPIFVDSESGRTFAELTPAEKAARSHRGKALRMAVRFLSGAPAAQAPA